MVIVHHTRKLAADDKFDMIAGTNGLLGAADGGFVLSKEKRTSNAAVLDVTGRDQEDQRLHLNKNPKTLVWELESVETELWQEIRFWKASQHFFLRRVNAGRVQHPSCAAC